MRPKAAILGTDTVRYKLLCLSAAFSSVDHSYQARASVAAGQPLQSPAASATVSAAVPDAAALHNFLHALAAANYSD